MECPTLTNRLLILLSRQVLHSGLLKLTLQRRARPLFGWLLIAGYSSRVIRPLWGPFRRQMTFPWQEDAAEVGLEGQCHPRQRRPPARPLKPRAATEQASDRQCPPLPPFPPFPPRACARALPTSLPRNPGGGGEEEGSREKSQGSLARRADRPRWRWREALWRLPEVSTSSAPRVAAAAMAAPLASPGRRSRFEQEQDRAVRALVRSVTGLPEEELGGGRFQTALNFAWSNFRSAPATPAPGRSSAAATAPRCPSAAGLGAIERAPSPRSHRRCGGEGAPGGAGTRCWAGPPPLCCGTAVWCDPLPPARLETRRVPCGCWGVVQGRVLPYPPCRVSGSTGGRLRVPVRGLVAITLSLLNLGLLGLFCWSVKRYLSTSSFSHPKFCLLEGSKEVIIICKEQIKRTPPNRDKASGQEYCAAYMKGYQSAEDNVFDVIWACHKHGLY